MVVNGVFSNIMLIKNLRNILIIRNEDVNLISIGFLGKTGVGKTTLINKLIGSNGRISHTKACTEDITDYEVKLENDTYKFIDFPGLGDCIGNEKKTLNATKVQ